MTIFKLFDLQIGKVYIIFKFDVFITWIAKQNISVRSLIYGTAMSDFHINASRELLYPQGQLWARPFTRHNTDFHIKVNFAHGYSFSFSKFLFLILSSEELRTNICSIFTRFQSYSLLFVLAKSAISKLLSMTSAVECFAEVQGLCS